MLCALDETNVSGFIASAISEAIGRRTDTLAAARDETGPRGGSHVSVSEET